MGEQTASKSEGKHEAKDACTGERHGSPAVGLWICSPTPTVNKSVFLSHALKCLTSGRRTKWARKETFQQCLP